MFLFERDLHSSFVAYRVATRKLSIAMSDDEKQGNAAMSGKHQRKSLKF